MKKKFNYLIALGVLSTTLISNHFVISAIDKPVKPAEITGEITNEKIKVYNEQVNDYNKQVDEYNQKIDEEYNSSVASVKQQNEEIDKHNAAETTKMAEVQARNTEKQTKYNEELAQYNKDKEIEAKILKKGFASVEAYNEYINTNWNNPANLSVEKNATSIFNIDASYSITKGEEVSSGNSGEYSSDESEDTEPEVIKVHIEHNFPEANLNYTKDLEIAPNDIITFYAAGAQLESVEANTVLFYMKSDDSHTMGYWWQGNSTLMCTANAVSDDWNCGDVHIVSYREGKKHASDSPDIDMIYNYNWTPLATYPTYNIPKEPKLELEEYTPDIKEHIADPIKQEHLEHMNLMDLIKESKPKKDKPKPKKEKKEKIAETQSQDPEPASAQVTKQPEPIIGTPAPTPQTKTITRQYQTDDRSVLIKFRIAIIIISILILLWVYFSSRNIYKKEKEDKDDLP